jgi:hypothetical protein
VLHEIFEKAAAVDACFCHAVLVHELDAHLPLHGRHHDYISARCSSQLTELHDVAVTKYAA